MNRRHHTHARLTWLQSLCTSLLTRLYTSLNLLTQAALPLTSTHYTFIPAIGPMESNSATSDNATQKFLAYPFDTDDTYQVCIQFLHPQLTA